MRVNFPIVLSVTPGRIPESYRFTETLLHHFWSRKKKCQRLFYIQRRTLTLDIPASQSPSPLTPHLKTSHIYLQESWHISVRVISVSFGLLSPARHAWSVESERGVTSSLVMWHERDPSRDEGEITVKVIMVQHKQSRWISELGERG